jgi:serine/threonine protein kinase
MRLRAFERESEQPATRSSARRPDLSRSRGNDVIRTVGLLGAGGSSQVWHARDASGRSIALKTLLPELSGRHGALELLLREHETLLELRHPHVVATLGVVEFRGAPALAMEYLGGGDLVPLLGAEPQHWLPAARAVLTALEHVHSRGYVHRDLKARNVLFDDHNRIRLVDFAQAALRGSAPLRGGTTAAYRSPAGDTAAVDCGEDAYAYAVLLHELIFGRLPTHDAGTARPLGPSGESLAPGLRVLAALVNETLSRGTADAAGSLSAFGDVLESVPAGG